MAPTMGGFSGFLLNYFNGFGETADRTFFTKKRSMEIVKREKLMA
jgi:hypothetical protein